MFQFNYIILRSLPSKKCKLINKLPFLFRDWTRFKFSVPSDFRPSLAKKSGKVVRRLREKQLGSYSSEDGKWDEEKIIIIVKAFS